MTDITQADRDAAADCIPYATKEFRLNIRLGRHDGNDTVQTLAAHREAAFQAGVKAGLEAAAKLCEARMEDRFAEHGTREPDTNATYYSGRYRLSATSRFLTRAASIASGPIDPGMLAMISPSTLPK